MFSLDGVNSTGPAKWDTGMKQELGFMFRRVKHKDPVMMFFLDKLSLLDGEKHINAVKQKALLDAEAYLYAVGEKREFYKELSRLRREVEELRRRL
jgi:hypothetical protein